MVWQSKSGRIADSLFRFLTTIRGKLCWLFLAVLVPTLAIQSIEYYNQFRRRKAIETKKREVLMVYQQVAWQYAGADEAPPWNRTAQVAKASVHSVASLQMPPAIVFNAAASSG